MLQAANRYHLGISKDGGVVFWEIDDAGVVHNGKIMYYLDTCHRDKTHTPTWVVAKLKSSGRLPQTIDNPHCLFGLHLISNQAGPLMVPAYLNERATGGAVASPFEGGLGGNAPLLVRFLGASEKMNKYGNKGVAIVESEKSAIILSELFPDYLWMASGGKTMLNGSLFAPLGDHRIILFPDTDETSETYRLWCTIAQEATKLYKSRIRVSNLLELHATAAQKAAKIDIVDFLFPTL